MRLALDQGCGSPPAPSPPIHRNIRPHCEKHHPSLSSHVPGRSSFQDTHWRGVWLPLGLQNSPGNCWLNFRPHGWGKQASSCFAFQGLWVVTPIQLPSLSSNRENIQLCLFPLFRGNLIYFCEFLNIYNPFIEDLLGGICLLWEVKERPRKWFSILSAS